MKLIKKIIENIIAFILAVFLFGTLYIVFIHLIDKSKNIQFTWRTYIITSIVLVILISIDFINQYYKNKKK